MQIFCWKTERSTGMLIALTCTNGRARPWVSGENSWAALLFSVKKFKKLPGRVSTGILAGIINASSAPFFGYFPYLCRQFIDVKFGCQLKKSEMSAITKEKKSKHFRNIRWFWKKHRFYWRTDRSSYWAYQPHRHSPEREQKRFLY